MATTVLLPGIVRQLPLSGRVLSLRRGQQQTSRPHELVHDTEHEDTDKHEHQRRHDLGEGVKAGVGGVEGRRPDLRGTTLGGESAGQRGERQTLREGELVQGLGETVRADTAPGSGAQQGVLQV